MMEHNNLARATQVSTSFSVTVFTSRWKLGKRFFVTKEGNLEKEQLPPLDRGDAHLETFESIDELLDNCLLSERFDRHNALAF
jgi:hypothetical protein